MYFNAITLNAIITVWSHILHYIRHPTSYLGNWITWHWMQIALLSFNNDLPAGIEHYPIDSAIGVWFVNGVKLSFANLEWHHNCEIFYHKSSPLLSKMMNRKQHIIIVLVRMYLHRSILHIDGSIDIIWKSSFFLINHRCVNCPDLIWPDWLLTRGPIQYRIRRLIVRSREVLKAHDRVLKYSYSFEICPAKILEQLDHRTRAFEILRDLRIRACFLVGTL